ncbi:MAG: asparagine synthase-related protein [Candidatus Cohnella colombiensis]|uniref:asparagine synthase (glutamine-hydrolyzing) n=1 Tax=Candidatus Cohnella colombiensis TaxID=3121368 RepID=A0AA95EWT6_9BACL|nr:MAG: asparagine synthase-related protein [Cohnella sp.]
MSAIHGIYHFHNQPVPLEHGLNLMQELAQYPADDTDYWHSGSIFLGNHAQWITPESIHEQQPHFNANLRLAITADAIIDNRDELYERLQIHHNYRKEITDSELIMLSYHRWGEDCPKFLVGDFAFMIWDEMKQALFGARDFSGTRTLYFHQSSDRFAFCTTIKPLLTLPYIDQQLNERWIAEYLATPGRLETVDAFSTVYGSIGQVPPSHSITISNGAVTFTRYCTFNDDQSLKLKSNEEYEEATRAIFQQAIDSRLRTYHQVGSYLSGGLDSGSVVSFAARTLREQNKRLYTYSYVPEKDFVDWTSKRRMADERPYIQSTVAHVGNIDDHYLDFQGKSPLSAVDECLDTMEMPYTFVENSFWVNGIFERAKQQGVGVLLNGGRGNHSISWGPAVDYYATLLKRFQFIRLYREMNQYRKNFDLGRRQLLSLVSDKAFSKKENSADGMTDHILINSQFAKKTNVYEMLESHGMTRTGTHDSIQNRIGTRALPFNRIMNWTNSGVNGTKQSLRHGIWYRDPMNDLRVVKFCLSVPTDQFVQNGMDRALIRRSMVGFIPDKVRLNYKVRGIQGADALYRMQREWSTFMNELEEVCHDERMNEYLDMTQLRAIISRMRNQPDSKEVFDGAFTMLMRALIVYRFVGSLERR